MPGNDEDVVKQAAPAHTRATGRASPDLLAEYEAGARVYAQFGDRLKVLLEDLLKQAKVGVHSVSTRVKKRRSLERKIARKEGKYTSLGDVTDVLGVRIITHFSDDVDKVAQILEAEFNIDPDRSVDKRALLEPDRFGYLSLHYVASLGDSRSKLKEYERFADLYFEIQVRSLLQHAWAEIQHDLGYKSEMAVPRQIRRRFARLAGLLELADEDFVGLRDELASYAGSVDHQVVEAPAAVFIDQSSLLAYIQSSDRVRQTDKQIAKIFGTTVSEDAEEEAELVAGIMSTGLQFLGLQTISDVDQALAARQVEISRFATAWKEEDGSDAQDLEDNEDDEEIGSGGQLTPGMSLWYLAYVLAARDGDLDRALSLLRVTGAVTSRGRDEAGARAILAAFQRSNH